MTHRADHGQWNEEWNGGETDADQPAPPVERAETPEREQAALPPPASPSENILDGLHAIFTNHGIASRAFDERRLVSEVVAWAAHACRQSPPPAREPVITGETSDGYHTFNELYAYRKGYNALAFNSWAARGLYDVHKSWKHSDGEPCFGGGWFIVMAETPAGQISNHYKTDDWSLFQIPERERANLYDGHTPQVALDRVLSVAALPKPLPREPDRDARDAVMAKLEQIASSSVARISYRGMADRLKATAQDDRLRMKPDAVMYDAADALYAAAELQKNLGEALALLKAEAEKGQA